ncbi:lytic murein transglycosylase [Patescibacteria group bacterium]|nr:lytic murein transglycosylase [Patescibacteria group bacterium]
MSKIFKINFDFYKAAFFMLLFFVIPSFAFAAGINDLKQDLENQIKQKQQEINQHQQNIQETQQKSKTLNNEIQILESQIDKIRLEVRQVDLTIQKSNLNIQEIDGQIGDLTERVDEKKDLLAEYIRTVAYYDQETLLEVILKNDQFSDFFNQISALESVQEEIQSILGVIHEIKDKLTEEKNELEDEREEQNKLKSFQLVQQRSVEGIQWQREDLLDKTKGEEKRYQQLIQGAEKDITYIKEQLSLLEKYNLTLDEAVQYAIFAATKTGIRPAFLLGVLEAESRLGLNVGTGNYKKDLYQCYMSLGYITRATKEKNAFIQICEELGLNPDTQPVSAEPWYGCGGAMGVAQFMPATWLAYRDDVAALTGNNPPNPWNHKDAFMAAAIKLSRGGANQRTEIGERTAYAKYLGGSNYSKWVYHSVTNYVINLTNKFQQQYFN